MSTLEILGTVYQVEQRGQYQSEEEQGVLARPLNTPAQSLVRRVGENLIRLGAKLTGQPEQTLPLHKAQMSTR
jgi:hypothetical protein